MSELLETCTGEGVDPALLSAVEESRAAHPLDAALRPRIPAPAFTYYGKEVWEQALAALLCGENLLLAGGKATGKNVLAENLSAAFGRPAWDISFHVNMDAASLIGMDTFADGRVEFRPGPVYRCAQCGGFGVLDDIDMAKNVEGAGRAVRSAGLTAAPLTCPATTASRWPRRPASSYHESDQRRYLGAERGPDLPSWCQMPTITRTTWKSARAQFPDLCREVRPPFALLFLDLQKKCDSAEISTKALDLRGMLDALLIRRERASPQGPRWTWASPTKTFDGF